MIWAITPGFLTFFDFSLVKESICDFLDDSDAQELDRDIDDFDVFMLESKEDRPGEK